MVSPSSVTVRQNVHNWVWGLIPGDSAVMGAACGQNGVASIAVEHGLGDWTLFILTAGIYTRSTVVFTCQ
jgi:hypothetical protein